MLNGRSIYDFINPIYSSVFVESLPGHITYFSHQFVLDVNFIKIVNFESISELALNLFQLRRTVMDLKPTFLLKAYFLKIIKNL